MCSFPLNKIFIGFSDDDDDDDDGDCDVNGDDDNGGGNEDDDDDDDFNDNERFSSLFVVSFAYITILLYYNIYIACVLSLSSFNQQFIIGKLCSVDIKLGWNAGSLFVFVLLFFLPFIAFFSCFLLLSFSFYYVVVVVAVVLVGVGVFVVVIKYCYVTPLRSLISA